jgi:hypothetical protein
MTIEEAVYTYLLGITAITDIVSTRIYPAVLPQGVDLPALTYMQISNPVHHDVDIAYPRMQISSWAENYADVKSLFYAVKEAMQRYKGVMGGASGVKVSQVVFLDSFDAYNQATGIWHIPSDYKIIYREV